MCGIVGYVGTDPAGPVVLDILRKVEYRGYDSAGAATLDGDKRLKVRRTAGKLSVLESELAENPLPGTIGIGHTRWATHGKPEERNAHPHVAGKVAVVHNGIIENFQELRRELEREGCVFSSDTDTEVVPQLVNRNLDWDMSPLEATREAVGRLRGMFALALLFEGYDDMLVVARKGSPLVVGFGNSGSFVGSDELALAALADRILHLEENDIAVVTREGTTVYDRFGRAVKRAAHAVTSKDLVVSKGGYGHYMLKEIHEQPDALRATISSFSCADTHRIRIEGLPFDFRTVERLSIIACGTASYAGLVAKYLFESLAGIPVDWDIASEFRYREAPLTRGQAGIFISQSGETADTLASLNHMKEAGCPTLAVINVKGSSIARAADVALRTLAGPEIGVASTKAFTTQLSVLTALAIEAARARDRIDPVREEELMRELDMLPVRMSAALALEPDYVRIAEVIARARDVFYVGRGTSYPLALEGALKLKEISYIHAESYAAGELKHGPLALIEDDVPVIAIAPRDRWFDKTASNLQEIAARSGKVILLSSREGCAELERYVSMSVAIPDTDPVFNPILYAVPIQLIAYHAAVLKGTEVDQPRNLAKSVTVE